MKQLQKKCKEYAESLRVLVRKVRVEGRRGWPDLELIFPVSGETVRVEMKNPNGEGHLAVLQKREHNRIKKQNAAVYTCDNFEYFKVIVGVHLIVED